MQKRTFARSALQLTPIGLGCMGMSWGYAQSQRDDQQSIQVIRAALDAGVQMLDTADIYGDGHNERLVGQAVAGRRDQVFVASKCGLVVDDLATKQMHRDGRPEHIRAAAQASLRRLGIDVIDLYYLHRVDPAVPLEETWGAMSRLVADGLVRHIGLSEVSVAQAESADAQHPVAAIQSEMSLWTRDAMGATPTLTPDAGAAGPTAAFGDVLGWCAANGTSFVPFAPLGRGFLTGSIGADGFEADDIRAVNPRFTPAAMARNQHIVEVVRQVAARHGASPAQVAIAWTLAQGEQVLPIPGTRSAQHLASNLAAADLRLDEADLSVLDDLPTPVGSRY